MRKIISICLVLAMLLTMIPFTVVSADEGDFEISGNKLVRYNGSSSSVTVPAEVEVIGSGAFMNNRTITSVRFAGKVKTIQSNAFAGCTRLARVSFSDLSALESIGSYAFAGCLPMNPSWANGVKSVAGNAFDGCNINAQKPQQPANTPPVTQLPPTPTPVPTATPEPTPTPEPTATPTVEPTPEPTPEPTATPTVEPTPEPTPEPTATPTVEPTPEPTAEPTVAPTAEPTAAPTTAPSVEPTAVPTVEPSVEPTIEPTAEPTDEPAVEPTATPTVAPSVVPTVEPTAEPTTEPDVEPTEEPAVVPTVEPTVEPIPDNSEDVPVDEPEEETENSGLTSSGGRETELVITQQPESVRNVVGQDAIFTVVAEGDGLTYQWYYSYNRGTNWSKSPAASAKTATLVIPITTGRNNYQYRCTITDANGAKVTSDAAILTVGEPIIVEPEKVPLAITQHPENVTNIAGTNAVFTVVAQGEELTYQWQYSYNRGMNWAKSPADTAKTSSLVIPITTGRNNYQYRCIVTDGDGNKVTSNAATLIVGEPVVEEPDTVVLRITKQPESVRNVVGTNAVFTVEAQGEELTYQWQYSYNRGTNWSKSPADTAKTNSLVIPITTSRNNYQYRCIITDAEGNKVTSEAATLTVGEPVVEEPDVDPIVITRQPSNVANAIGLTAYFTVAATGEELTYQWQYSYNSGKNWAASPVASATSTTLEIPITKSRNNYLYRCVITDAEGHKLTSAQAKLTALANTFTVNDVTYFIISNTTVEVKSYSGSAASLTIPATVNGYNVVRVGNAAFEGNTTLTSIDLPDSILTIGSRAFANCSALSAVN